MSITNTTNDLADHEVESTTNLSNLNMPNMSYLTRLTDDQLLQAVINELGNDNESEISNEIRPNITAQSALVTSAKALKHFKVVRLVLAHLFGAEITFPIADVVAGSHAGQEAKLLTLYCSTRSKTLVEKVLGCPANEVTPALVHHFFGRLAWIDESTLTGTSAQAQLEKYLFGINPFWDKEIQLGAGDYSELGGLLTPVPTDLRSWMIQFKRGERLYIAAEWLATVSAADLYDGFAQGEGKKDAAPLLVFTTAFDRLLAPLPHEYQDNLLVPALTKQISSVASWLSIEIYLSKMADASTIDLGEPVSLATRMLFYHKITQYVINPDNGTWLATDIERAQNAPGMQTLSLAISLRREHSTLKPEQALKIAALLLAPMIIQAGESQEVENAPNPLPLIDPLPKLNVLLAASSSTAPADQLFNLIGIDTLCQHNGTQRQLRKSARDTWQALMQTTQFTEFSAPLLKRIGWYGGEAKERTSPRVTQALVGKVIIEHFLGATVGTTRSIMQEFRDNQATEYTHAQMFDRLKASITLRNPGVSTATLDMLHYLLCREIAPELFILNVPDSLCYGRSLQSVALLHGIALLEAMTPGASHGAKFDDVVTLSAQLASSQDPSIQKLWVETQVYPALRYAQAHNAITPINDIHRATTEQITTAVNYLRDQQNQHANALNKLQSKAPDRRAIAEHQLTNAGVDQQYWSGDPRPHQEYLTRCHVLEATEETWDESKANFFTNWGAGPHERGGYIPHTPEAYPSLVDLMMMGDRYIEGVQDVPHAFDSAFTLFSQTITAAETDIIQRLLLELPASDRTLLATSTCELSRLKFADEQAYQGIFIRCQSGDHSHDFKQHNTATEAYFEIIPAAGVARKIEQSFDYGHHYIADQPDRAQ
ncbi:hypothetical protein SK355_11480 [Candidatus Fukatsuia symbiotica]|uniref:Uncharacterized protein n=1 Tax=Candidatus Fukatsuia symbiotica TaxID=1878942 RepID=A0A2U8I435_9GAMM|nr:hypothetical protein [Candidatus Fukatsuia symbiotica]AWK13869.1 hypothetical protein CCS41_04290 [Candidatus Fukatsuia symbiotica]MEA9445802.1 hypothetical protein [Candidatus Fukatsuia symbiotica]